MADLTFTCPRCFATIALKPGMRFCPRCGLAEAPAAAADTAPLELRVNGQQFSVGQRIAVGSVTTVYRCQFEHAGKRLEGVFKISRDARSNGMLINEANVLRQLHSHDVQQKFSPFIPAIEASVSMSDSSTSPARQANVLRMHPAIRSVDELYTLDEVRAAYPTGLDARDMAWIWRRLLMILGYAHQQRIVHCAVLPMHILIEPTEHKLLLIDFCCASAIPAANGWPIIMGGYLDWYERQSSSWTAPTPTLDIGLGARCMLQVLGRDPLDDTNASGVEPALWRHFQRCTQATEDSNLNAWRLLDDFDRLIESLWGPRQFRQLPMPDRRR